MATKTKRISKVLIANRGEIAVRVNHTLQQMGIQTVSVFSDPDRNAPHALCTDEAFALPGETAAETYLQADRIIELAKQNDVDAIHPGYGFLSENAPFAEKCAKAGIIFIGPSANVIRDLGDKICAKAIMEKAGVPVVPGWSGDEPTHEILKDKAQRIGYPVLIKAAAGGGGKGMRVVQGEDDLASSVEAAQREAAAAFGDSRIFLEKYFVNPRHIEVQIIGDAHGNVCHLFERECSIQRRHQKIIEESPATVLSSAKRDAITQAAVRAAQAVGYTNAGTVEFLVDAQQNFYFLEVNTRLQVEHPVTELTTSVDLVHAQMQVAMGEPLPFSQDDIQQCGHAIECRIYAEDPENGFLPSVGTIDHYEQPSGPGVRVDSGVVVGSEVSVFYDPMLSKLVCWAPTRDQAIAKMIWSLERYVVMGVVTNVPFLRELIDHVDFRNSDVHTHFLDDNKIDIAHPDQEDALLAAAIAVELGWMSKSTNTATGSQTDLLVTPWTAAGGWRVGS